MHTTRQDLTKYYSGPPLYDLPDDIRGRIRAGAQALAEKSWTGKLCVSDLGGNWPSAAIGYREYAILDDGHADELYIRASSGATFCIRFVDGGDSRVRLAAQHQLGVQEPAGLAGRPGPNGWVVVAASMGGSSAFSPARTGPAIGIPVNKVP